MASPRVILVGAGPAGVRAAETLVEAGLRPTLVDEAWRSGGQIYRRQPANFTRPLDRLYGTEAGNARALHAAADALRDRVDYLPNTLAWNVRDGALYLQDADAKASAVPFDALVIAAGATDRVIAMPGWTLPGVYSLGAAQIALKAQACSIGRKVAFVGTGPLLYLVAYQYAEAGTEVVAVLDTSPRLARLLALPVLAARLGTLAKGWAYVRALRRRRVPIFTGVVPVGIEGNASAGVTKLVARKSGRRLVLNCDAVALGYHLRPETQLADLAQCSFVFDRRTHQWMPEVDEDGRTSQKGIYLAGDGAHILGADGAEIQGRLAAYALLKDLGRSVPEGAVRRLRSARRRMDRFRRGIARAFPWPWRLAAALPDDTIVCRCEAISAGEIRDVVRGKGANELNRAKAFSRVGMGRCQGRYCGHTAAELLADAAGIPIEAVGRLRSQAPVKPLPIATDLVVTP